MKILLCSDETLSIDFKTIAEVLNNRFSTCSFSVQEKHMKIPGEIIESSKSYKKIWKSIQPDLNTDVKIIGFTGKSYDNNYFWDPDGSNLVVMSMSGWEYLTDLPKNNGAVYFICAWILRLLKAGKRHYDGNTGCINDFWEDKRGINAGMRTAFICDECLELISAELSNDAQKVVRDMRSVLDELSSASRIGADVCAQWENTENGDQCDVFLCHNSEDKPEVRKLNTQLKSRSIRTWIDEDDLPPGRMWQDHLEEQIKNIGAAAVLVGNSGLGPWQEVEIKAFLQEFVRRRCPVIPVILSDCTTVPTLPLFLRQLTWVDFRKNSPDPLDRLCWGITGVKPRKLI